MDENKEVNSTDPKREKVRVIPLLIRTPKIGQCLIEIRKYEIKNITQIAE